MDDLPIETLCEFSDFIRLNSTDVSLLERINVRLSRLEKSPDALWRELEKISETHDSDAHMELPGVVDIQDLLTRTPDFTLPRSLEVLDALLTTNTENYLWMHVFAVDLLGKMRHLPSRDSLIEVIEGLVEPGDDSLEWQSCLALARLGADHVVPAIRNILELYDGELDPIFAFTLASMRNPLAEMLQVELLLRAEDPGETCCIALELMQCCTTDKQALEFIRNTVENDRWDFTFSDPLPVLTALCEMIDWQPPELSKWRQELAAPDREAQMKKRRMEVLAPANGGIWGRQARDLERLIEADEIESPGGYGTRPFARPSADFAVPVPLRRQEPKIGRNDPCPCGSGKKFKKCCLK